MKILRDPWCFYLCWNKVTYFCFWCHNALAAKEYSFDIFSLKMITTSKFMGRVSDKLKNIVHNNSRETIFNFLSFSRKILYISFVYCKGMIPLIWRNHLSLIYHGKLFSKLALVFCYFLLFKVLLWHIQIKGQ